MKIDSFTGQDRIISAIIKQFALSNLITVNIFGNPGSGKSWLLNRLSEDLSMDDTYILKLRGDSLKSKEPYYPLNNFIQQTKYFNKKGLKAVKELIGEIPVVGASLKSLLEDIDLQDFIRDNNEYNQFELNTHIQFSSHILSIIKKYKTIAILCDDYNNFDENTLKYFDNLVKFLNWKKNSKQIILIFTLNQNQPLNNSHIQSISFEHFNFTLNKIDQEHFYSILVEFGLTEKVPPTAIEPLLTITAGHLHIIKLLSSFINNQNHPINYNSINSILIYNLIDAKLDYYTENSMHLKNILSSIRSIGNSIEKSAVFCIFDLHPDVQGTLKLAEELEIIIIQDEIISFANELIGNYFNNINKKSDFIIYEKYIECLKILNPSNYFKRALLFKRIGELIKADIYNALHIIQRLRYGMFNDVAELVSHFASTESKVFEAIVLTFLKCYQYHFKGDLNNAILEINQLDLDIPFEIYVEKTIIECEILIKNADISYINEAITKLESINYLKESESEQWYRIAHLRVLAYAELGDFDNAMKVEQEILQYFSTRVKYDNYAKEILIKLNLYSGILYNPEIANIKLLKACSVLKDKIDNEEFDNLINYYISLCNLSGNSLSISHLDVSLTKSKIALDLKESFPFIDFPHIEVPLNNYLLASYFSKIEPTKLILKSFGELSKIKDEEDGILLSSNYAGILVCEKELNLALSVLYNVTKSFGFEQINIYYSYYINYNFALVNYLIGAKNKALDLLEKLAPLTQQVNIKLQKYYQRHYDLTLEIIREFDNLSYESFCAKFCEKEQYYLGITWERFKSVYLFSDLQIWTQN